MLKTENLSLLDYPPDYETEAKSAQAIGNQRRASAWPVHRFPMERLFAQKKTRLHLPLSYLARDGIVTKTVFPGEDINQAVWKFYSEPLAKEDKVNYVHADKVDERRHEYLGPDPRIGGYHRDAQGDLHVRWWDAFLQDQWMDDGKWKVEVVWAGHKWTEKYTF